MTNNTPIAAWAPSTALAKLASRHNNSPCVLTDGPAEFNDVALVRLADYKALQAAYEEELFQVRQTRDSHFGELVRALEQVDALQDENEELKRALSESQANDRQAMSYLNQVRELVGGDDFPDMVERVAKLQAECRMLESELATVKKVAYGNVDLLDECEKLRKAIRRLCNLYEVDDYYMGQLREERLEAAVNQVIEQVKEINHDNQ